MGLAINMFRRLVDLKMVVFDLDGVLVDINSSWQKIHEAFGVTNEENFQKHLRGEIDFKEFMRSDIRLWSGVHISHIKNILDKVPLMKGATETLSSLKKAGYKTAIISSGISILANRVKDELGIDDFFSNKLLTDKDGRLTGEGEEVVGLLNKGNVLNDLALKEGFIAKQCVVVGDSRYDIPLFKESGLSIAFNAKDDMIKEAADLVIDEKDLRLILPWLVNIKRASMAELIFNYNDEKEANTIAQAVSPDNIKVPSGLIIKTVKEECCVITRIFCIKGVETLLATIEDLLSCTQVAEKVVKITKNLQ